MSLSLASSSSGGMCWVSISGLQDPWNQSNYLTAGIAEAPFTDGQTEYPSAVASVTVAPSTGSQTSFGWTAANLGFGQKTYYAWCQSNEGRYYSVGSGSIYIPYPVVNPDPPYGIVVYTVTEKTVDIRWAKGANATSTIMYMWSEFDDEADAWSGESAGYAMVWSELTAGVTYYFKMRSYNITTDTYSGWTSTQSFITNPPPGPPANITYSADKLTALITFTKGVRAVQTALFYWEASNPSVVFEPKFTDGTGFFLTSLWASTQYGFKLVSYSAEWSASADSPTYYFITGMARPQDAILDGPFNTGDPATLSSTQWLYFKWAINDFRTYMSAGTYTFANNPQPGEDLTAAEFNDVLSAISGLSAYMAANTLPAAVASGADVYGYYFNALRNSLNSIP